MDFDKPLSEYKLLRLKMLFFNSDGGSYRPGSVLEGLAVFANFISYSISGF